MCNTGCTNNNCHCRCCGCRCRSIVDVLFENLFCCNGCGAVERSTCGNGCVSSVTATANGTASTASVGCPCARTNCARTNGCAWNTCNPCNARNSGTVATPYTVNANVTSDTVCYGAGNCGNAYFFENRCGGCGCNLMNATSATNITNTTNTTDDFFATQYGVSPRCGRSRSCGCCFWG